LKPLLPVGCAPLKFLMQAQAADKMTAKLVGQMAITSHACATKLQVLQAEEEAMHELMLAQLASIKAEYLEIATSNQAEAQVGHESLIVAGEELQGIHLTLTEAVEQTEETAAQLESADYALKQALASCRSTLNQRIAR
jgi:hypothetical protein